MDSTASTPHQPPMPTVPLAVTDEQSTALLNDTIALFSNGLPREPGTEAATKIERWEAVLAASDRPGLAKIIQELGQLGELLADPQGQTHDVAELLASLGAETAKAAEGSDGYAAPLGNLSKQLIKAANSLSSKK